MIFHATGIGSMQVMIPNRKSMANVTLNNILYSPELAFTLISLTRCDKYGYSTLLKNQKCTIRDPNGRRVGEIPLMDDGLYKVEQDTHLDTANASRKLSIDEVHR
jgi:hypothetical protein